MFIFGINIQMFKKFKENENIMQKRHGQTPANICASINEIQVVHFLENGTSFTLAHGSHAV